MKKLLFFTLFLAQTLCFSQTTSLIASKTSSQFIEADEFVGEDIYNNLYYFKNNSFFKKSKHELFHYKNVSFGKITKVDLQNPLRILLFYQNFNALIVLDNQLNEIQRINFSEIDNSLTLTAVGNATQNGYWFFDQNIQQLKIYHYTSGTFQNIGTIFDTTIKNYDTALNYFYWIDTENILYRSDLFGKKQGLGKIPEYDRISFNDGLTLIYEKDQKLYLFEVTKNKSTLIENVQNSFKSFYFKNQNLTIFTPEGITNYRINLP